MNIAQPTDLKQLPLCPNPVFIIGSPRSGTTILAWSLHQHSRLWTSDESDVLFPLFSQIDKIIQKAGERGSGGWLKLNGVDRAEFLQYLALGPNALFTSRSKDRRWVDQTPLYTLIVDILADMFPGAQFVHILRDGRRVVNSMINFLKAPGVREQMIQSGFIGSWTTDFREACRTWTRYVDSAMDFQRRRSDRVITVNNEQMMADPHGGFASVFEFLKIPNEPASAAHFQNNRINSSFQSDSKDQIVVRKLSQPWEEWNQGQRQVFLEESGETMIRHGLATRSDMCVDQYPELVQRIREAIVRTVRAGTRYIVISDGEEEFVNVDGRTGLHFPRTKEGYHSEGHPATGAEAVAALEESRREGAKYLVVPATALWWLDHYAEFRRHLDEKCTRVAGDESECVIFQLDESPAAVPA